MQDTADEQINPFILGNEQINQAESCWECPIYVITHPRDLEECFMETTFFLRKFKCYVSQGEFFLLIYSTVLPWSILDAIWLFANILTSNKGII